MLNVVITGRTRGIGLAMAIKLLDVGNVTISGRNESIPDTIIEKLSKFVELYDYVSCNVQIKSDVQNSGIAHLKNGVQLIFGLIMRGLINHIYMPRVFILEL